MEIVVSNKTSRPLYEQISTQVKAQIMSGELKAGEPLPSIRALAKSLQISVLTVQKAYDLLQADGLSRRQRERAALFPRKIRTFIWRSSKRKSRSISAKRLRLPAQAGYLLRKC